MPFHFKSTRCNYPADAAPVRGASSQVYHLSHVNISRDTLYSDPTALLSYSWSTFAIYSHDSFAVQALSFPLTSWLMVVWQEFHPYGISLVRSGQVKVAPSICVPTSSFRSIQLPGTSGPLTTNTIQFYHRRKHYDQVLYPHVGPSRVFPHYNRLWEFARSMFTR